MWTKRTEWACSFDSVYYTAEIIICTMFMCTMFISTHDSRYHSDAQII